MKLGFDERNAAFAVQDLEKRATSVVAMSLLAGLGVGAACGYLLAPMVMSAKESPAMAVILCACIVGAIGGVIGQAKASMMRGQAQLIRAAVSIQREIVEDQQDEG